MINHVTDKNCIGCLACEKICPNGAITGNFSSGFIRPNVNESRCVNCGLCLKVCPKNFTSDNNDFIQQAYAVKHEDISVLNNSTSGGVFSAIADYTIGENGVVYGCINENGKILHSRTENDYSAMRGSKYVQSDLKNTHLSIISDLKKGKIVLFTGTPCQCASIKKFLSLKKIDATNLVLVDFVCHGTTSPILFEEYLSYYERKKNKKIKDHLFRSKICGWTEHTEMNILSDGTMDYRSYESQLFKSIFHSHLGMNEGCFECKYTSIERVSDITLADFWGVKNSHPDCFDESGVSFVLLNSIKGQEVFKGCKNVYKKLVSVMDTNQPALVRPATMPKKYNKFWYEYKKKGFNYVVKKYYNGGKLYRLLSDTYHRIFRR